MTAPPPLITVRTRPDQPGSPDRLAKLLARCLVEADRRRRERNEETAPVTSAGDDL